MRRGQPHDPAVALAEESAEVAVRWRDLERLRCRPGRSGPRPASSTPSTVQVSARRSCGSRRSRRRPRPAPRRPFRTGRSLAGTRVPAPPGPHTLEGRSPMPPKPPVRIPAAKRPSVADTMSPPSISSEVRVKISPRPMPMRNSGQNDHHRSRTAGSRRPVWTASGTPPATTKKTPQPARSRWIRTAGTIPRRPTACRASDPGRRACASLAAAPRIRPGSPAGRTPMRLSEWRTRAPHKDSMTPKVLAVIEPVMAALGAEDGSLVLDRLGRRPGRPLRDPRADGRRSAAGARPGQCARRGSARIREGDPLEPGAAGRARARDGRRPSVPGLPGRELRAARRRRRGRRDGLVRPRVVRPGRRPAVHAAGRQARWSGQGRRTPRAATGKSASAGARTSGVRSRARRRPRSRAGRHGGNRSGQPSS